MLKIKKIKPMFTALVTTMDKYTEPQFITGSSIIDPTKSKSGLKEYQKVLAIGESIRGIVVGDIVCINPSRYAQKKYTEGETKEMIQSMQQIVSYNFNTIALDNVECLLLDQRDIDFVIEEYEEVPDAPPTQVSPLISLSK